MNGYSVIFVAVLIVILAGVAAVLSWTLIRGVAALSHRPLRRRGHRGA